jgi:hypothetical protein
MEMQEAKWSALVRSMKAMHEFFKLKPAQVLVTRSGASVR